MALYESGENYLEAILLLSKQNNRVLPVDIARELGVSKPSVTRALKLLSENGLVINEPKNVQLTKIGKQTAAAIFERHTVITEFLVLHGVTCETATKDACRIEHYISEETFDCIKGFVSNNHRRDNQ